MDAFTFVDEDVGTADDPDGPASLVDYQRGAETAIRHEFERLADAGIAADGHGIGRHQVFGPE
jgi:hypothetical protein